MYLLKFNFIYIRLFLRRFFNYNLIVNKKKIALTTLIILGLMPNVVEWLYSYIFMTLAILLYVFLIITIVFIMSNIIIFIVIFIIFYIFKKAIYPTFIFGIINKIFNTGKLFIILFLICLSYLSHSRLCFFVILLYLIIISLIIIIKRKLSYLYLILSIDSIISLIGLGTIAIIIVNFFISSPNLPKKLYPKTNIESKSDFSVIYDVIADHSGNIYFNDKNSGRFGKISYPENEVTISEILIDGPERMMISSDGQIFVFGKGKDHGLYSLNNKLTIAKKLNSFFAIDLILDDINKTAFLIEEIIINYIMPKLCIYDYQTQKSYMYDLNKVFMPYGITYSKQHNAIYISGWFFSYQMIIVELSSNSAVSKIRTKTIGPFSLDIKVSESRDLLYISRPLIGKIDVFRISNLSRIARISAPMWVREFALSDDGSLLFAPNYMTGEMAVIKTADSTQCATYNIGTSSRALAFSQARNSLIASNPSEIFELPLSSLPMKCRSSEH